MERRGNISPVGRQTVKVHILDPGAGIGQVLGLAEEELEELGMAKALKTYRVEEWTIGKEVSDEEYRKFRNPGTRDLYVLLVYRAGKPGTYLVCRETWLQARAAMGGA